MNGKEFLKALDNICLLYTSKEEKQYVLDPSKKEFKELKSPREISSVDLSNVFSDYQKLESLLNQSPVKKK